MRIVFNMMTTLKPKTGVGHYADRLVNSLADLLDERQLTVFPSPRVADWCRRRQSPGAAIARKPGRVRPWLANKIKALGRKAVGGAFRRRFTQPNYDLYHEPNFLTFESSLPTVVTVHDLSVLLHPEWHPADRVRRHEKLFRQSVARAAHVITVSHVVRNEVIQHLGKNPRQVSAVHNGVGPEFFSVTLGDALLVRSQFNLPKKFLLYVGTIEPRKNLLMLLQAFAGIAPNIRARCPLVLAGGWGWRSEPVAEFLRASPVSADVIHLGYIPDSALGGLYRAAHALVFPSHYEGFGLPPLEMLATGGAVIASTALAHREVLGHCAELIQPNDVDAWRDALMRAILDDDWIGEIRKGGQDRAAEFCWQRCAAETIKVYERALAIRAAA